MFSPPPATDAAGSKAGRHSDRLPIGNETLVREPQQRETGPAWHALTGGDVLARQEVSSAVGLSGEQAAVRREVVGLNQLAEEPPAPAWKRLVAQFKDLVVWILIAAAVISGLLNEWVDTAAILAIVVVNGIIGYVQEARAERALASLQKLSAPLAKVLRGGQLVGVPAAELVPGDVIELEAGDNVPADARLLEAFSLRVQEAALTGESVPSQRRPTRSWLRPPRLVIAARWSTPVPSSRAGMPRLSLWPPECRASWGTSQVCSRGGIQRSRRCSDVSANLAGS